MLFIAFPGHNNWNNYIWSKHRHFLIHKYPVWSLSGPTCEVKDWIAAQNGVCPFTLVLLRLQPLSLYLWSHQWFIWFQCCPWPWIALVEKNVSCFGLCHMSFMPLMKPQCMLLFRKKKLSGKSQTRLKLWWFANSLGAVDGKPVTIQASSSTGSS